MGNHLDRLGTTNHPAQLDSHRLHKPHEDELRLAERVRAVVPWLDHKTSQLVAALVAVVATEHPEVQAAILFGSVARHQERPLEGPHPSDVDLLLIVAPDPVRQRLPYARQLALWESIGEVQYCHRDAPREVEVTPVESTLADWDEMFVTNVARDGRLLWIRNTNIAEEPLAALPIAWQHLAPDVTEHTKH